jgi:hypothetical protein
MHATFRALAFALASGTRRAPRTRELRTEADDDAIHERADLHFHFLHDRDQGKIRNDRVCTVCEERVPWDHVVRDTNTRRGST